VKEVIIIAGPNGAGKTTFANKFLEGETDLVFLNADEQARLLLRRGYAGGAVDIALGRELLRQVDQLTRDGRSFAVETTLATRLYARQTPLWRAAGYRILLSYLRLSSVEDSISRVRKRVAAGGHNVPEPILRRRFARSLMNLEQV
jgi:predicted ABC-type ATPase